MSRGLAGQPGCLHAYQEAHDPGEATCPVLLAGWLYSLAGSGWVLQGQGYWVTGDPNDYPGLLFVPTSLQRALWHALLTCDEGSGLHSSSLACVWWQLTAYSTPGTHWPTFSTMGWKRLHNRWPGGPAVPLTQEEVFLIKKEAGAPAWHHEIQFRGAGNSALHILESKGLAAGCLCRKECFYLIPHQSLQLEPPLLPRVTCTALFTRTLGDRKGLYLCSSIHSQELQETVYLTLKCGQWIFF